MSTDIEQQVRRGLADVPTPAGLALDAGTVTQVASRARRRHRTGQALVAGMSSLAVLGAAAWAGGALPATVQRALPASPWSSCPLTWNGTGYDVRLDAVEHAVLPLPDGTVVVGQARGCPEYDGAFFAATGTPADDLSQTVPLQSGHELREGYQAGRSFLADLRFGEQHALGLMVPAGSREVRVVGPGAVRPVPDEELVRVPGTDLLATALTDPVSMPSTSSVVWRGPDGLVRTLLGPATADGVDIAVTDRHEGFSTAESWVMTDSSGDQWVMRRGLVEGPYPASATAYAVPFPTQDRDRTELVVVLPEAGTVTLGDNAAAGWTLLETERLGDDPAPDARPLHAVVVTLEGVEADQPLPGLEWAPAEDGEPQAVEVVEP